MAHQNNSQYKEKLDKAYPLDEYRLSVRLATTAEKELLLRIDMEARERMVNRSTLVKMILNESLPSFSGGVSGYRDHPDGAIDDGAIDVDTVFNPINLQ